MQKSEHSHDPSAIRRRLAAKHRPSYLADAILGGIDGCVTTMPASPALVCPLQSHSCSGSRAL